MSGLESQFLILTVLRKARAGADGFSPLSSSQCSNDTSHCALYNFSSGINAIQEWYKLHYMNIMAQVPLEKKINMSYSAEELLVTCLFDGVSCDARSGEGSAPLALSPGPAPAALRGRVWE